MRDIGRVISCIVATLLLTSIALASESSSHSETKKAEKKVRLLPDKKLTPQLCTSLAKDNQLELFQEVILKSAEKEKECFSCISFYKAISTSCKRVAGTKKGNKKEPAAAMKKTPALDPSTELLDVVSQLFLHLREERELLEQKVKLVRRLILTMAERYGRSPQQRYYLQVLSGYIKAPFRSALQAKQLDTNAGGSKFPSKSQSDPGQMFE